MLYGPKFTARGLFQRALRALFITKLTRDNNMKRKNQGRKEWIVRREGKVTALLTTKQAVDAYTYFRDKLKYSDVEMIHINEFLKG